METAGLHHTAVLYALGWAIAHSLWQMGVLWLLYQLFFGLPKNMRPAYRYAAAVIFVMSGFIWFTFTFAEQVNTYQSINRYIERLPAAESALVSNRISDAGTSSQIINELFISFERFIPFLSAGYLTILIFLFIRLINAYGYTQKIRTQGLIPAGDFLDYQLLQFTRKLGLPSNIKVYLTELIDVPATIGFFKPVILLPLASINHLSIEQVESIILHELAHIRRQDYLLNILISVMETVLFFNPFAYQLVNALKKERELFCDDFVVAFKNDPHNYATALLHLEKLRKGSTALFAVAATGHDGVLLNRVKRIMKVNSQQFQYREKLIALLFISGLLSTLAWLNPVPGKSNQLSRTKENIGIQLTAEPTTLKELISQVENPGKVEKPGRNKQPLLAPLKRNDSLRSSGTELELFSDNISGTGSLSPSIQSNTENFTVVDYLNNEYAFSAPRYKTKESEEFPRSLYITTLPEGYAPYSSNNDSLNYIQHYPSSPIESEKELNQLLEKAFRLNAAQKPLPFELLSRIQEIKDLRFSFHYNEKQRQLREIKSDEEKKHAPFDPNHSPDIIYYNEAPRHPKEREELIAGISPARKRKTASVHILEGQPYIIRDGNNISVIQGSGENIIKRKTVNRKSNPDKEQQFFFGDEMRQTFESARLSGWGIVADSDSLNKHIQAGNIRRKGGSAVAIAPTTGVEIQSDVKLRTTITGISSAPARPMRINKKQPGVKTVSSPKITISIETSNETISIEVDQSDDN